MSSEIVEYKPIEAAIAEIQRFKGLVVDVNTSEGLAEGKAVARQAAAVRIALEKSRKKLKEDVLERGRQIDGQAKPLFARVAEIEDPINEQIEAHTKREARARQAEIDEGLKLLAAKQEAERKAEQERMAVERAEIKRQQDELAKATAERARQDAEARAVIEAEQRVAREKIEEERRQENLARQAREEVERVKRAEEAKRKAEEEAKAKALRDAEEAKQREIRRKQAEKADAQGMAKLFRDRYKHLPECAGIIAAIDEYLEAI